MSQQVYSTNLASLKSQQQVQTMPAQTVMPAVQETQWIEPQPQQNQSIRVSLDTVLGFEFLQRQGRLFAESTIVPDTFRGNLSNCAIAINLAQRLQMDPFVAMQQMYIVHGRPSFSSAFMIATFNKSGRFSPLGYVFEGHKGSDDYGCKATATDLSTGQILEGPTVTIGMAKKEGWYGKTGSKWQTMPELMLRYRAAAFLIRTTAPELILGLQTAEELHDIYDKAVPYSPEYQKIEAEEPVQDEQHAEPKRRRVTKRQPGKAIDVDATPTATATTTATVPPAANPNPPANAPRATQPKADPNLGKMQGGQGQVSLGGETLAAQADKTVSIQIQADSADSLRPNQSADAVGEWSVKPLNMLSDGELAQMFEDFCEGHKVKDGTALAIRFAKANNVSNREAKIFYIDNIETLLADAKKTPA